MHHIEGVRAAVRRSQHQSFYLRNKGELADFPSKPYFAAAANKYRLQLNAHSSRSHAILQVKIIQTADERTTISTVSAIDLAGSEDNRRTDNNKERLVESSSINKSLFVLVSSQSPYRSALELLEHTSKPPSSVCWRSSRRKSCTLSSKSLTCRNVGTMRRSHQQKAGQNPLPRIKDDTHTFSWTKQWSYNYDLEFSTRSIISLGYLELAELCQPNKED